MPNWKIEKSLQSYITQLCRAVVQLAGIHSDLRGSRKFKILPNLQNGLIFWLDPKLISPSENYKFVCPYSGYITVKSKIIFTAFFCMLNTKWKLQICLPLFCVHYNSATQRICGAIE